MALALDAKPTARRDIISAILSHYGDERDIDLDDHNDVLAAAYCQASPTPSPLDRSTKPLPSVPSPMQLRDRGRGTHRIDDSMQEPRARIMAPRSLSRSKRPPELRLVKSNGSTATSAKTPSQSSSPPADSPSRQHPERGRRHARGRLDDELPLPPPPPELPDKSDNDNMGSSKSKLQQNERSSPRRLHFSLRRKPVKKPSHAAADPPAPPATQQHETKVEPPQEPPPAPPPKLQKVKSDEALMRASSTSKHARDASNAVSEPVTSNERHHAPEPSDDTVVRIRRERSNTPPSEPDQNEPITPPLKPGDPVQLLPSPTPVPEESPSKWGLTKKSSNSAMANDADPKANLHFRGKSSTGFDIFKSTTNELKATAPLSPVLSPTVESPPVPLNENQKPLTSPAKPPTPPKDTPPASPILPSHQLFNSRIRPKRTTAAMLTRIHTACYHAHARFHRSSQRFVPIDCMMCFSNPPDHQWTCTWCALRICQPCRAKLDAVPRRNLDAIVQGRLQEWEKQRRQRDSMNPQYRNGKPETFRVRGREMSSVVPPSKLPRGSKSEPLAAGSWD
ncbi:hypothetical protein IWZ03DRAFT_416131 [Phyllosticta citriasiana]|uniref:Uncharacterized protein n=1 Tax=Phyllosticta citriasiana TaxID=595635 RepID=A0ABR1KHW9_9PEZI